jgi:hypothetical protein
MATTNQQLASLPQILVTDVNGNTISLSVQQLSTQAASLGNVANVFITGGNAGDIITTDGSGNLSFIPQPSLVANAGGGNSSIQFNNNGALDGASNFLYNPATDTVTVNNITVNGQMNVNGTAEYNLSDIKIHGGAPNQLLQTDGAGNLRWSSDLYPGTVTHVGANGSGLGFSITANINSAGNVTLITPDVAGLRSTLNLGTVANVFTTGETNKWLRADGTFTLPPGQNNPNLVVDGTVVPYANGNLEFRDSQYAYNQIDFRYANGAVTAELDYNSPMEFGNTFKVQEITIEDASQAVGITFKASNTAVTSQIYNLPDLQPSAAGQVLTATLPDANGVSSLSWANVSSNASTATEIVVYFSYTDQPTKVVGWIPAGSTVTDINVIVLTPFSDTSATLSVGDLSNANSLMPTTDIVAHVAGQYTAYPNQQFLARTQLVVGVTSATSGAGNGLVYITYH